MPGRNTLRQTFPHTGSAEQLNAVLGEVLGAIEGVTMSSDHWRLCENGSVAVVAMQAVGNTWSRSARRKQTAAVEALSSTVPPLLCRVGVCGEAGCFEVRFQWVRGQDRSLFEGFCSHVSRKVADKLITG